MADVEWQNLVMAGLVDWGNDQRILAPGVILLNGPDNGRYPSGNSLVVSGAGESVVIDPSVTVVEHGGAPVAIDAVIISHSHEDHMAGNGLFADARVHIHDEDLPGARSLDGLMEVYGLTGEPRAAFSREVVEHFHYTPRPDAQGFGDGHRWDLGGGVAVEAVHLPGHTRGHSGFRISGGVFFLSDIDLTGFGPYYGDVWSDLEQFEASLTQVRDEEAEYYVTFHHRGVVEGRERFVEALASVDVPSVVAYVQALDDAEVAKEIGGENEAPVDETETETEVETKPGKTDAERIQAILNVLSGIEGDDTLADALPALLDAVTEVARRVIPVEATA